jgi:Mlc titration factor MtfA (ptsG expression regulator)
MFRNWFNRRAKWLEEGLDAQQRELLAESVPQWNQLAAAEQRRLSGIVRVLLEEKSFEACGGITLTPGMKLSIAGYAGLMLLGGISDYFPDLRSILVYPRAYIAPVEEYDEAGILTIGREQRFGESWEMGSLVLAWDEIRRHQQTGSSDNLVIHEFAHQIDDELEISLEVERILNGNADTPWAADMAKMWEKFSRQPRTLPQVDPYGAEHHSEFFAVLSELFFTRSQALKADSPRLYEIMSGIYNYRAEFDVSGG